MPSAIASTDGDRGRAQGVDHALADEAPHLGIREDVPPDSSNMPGRVMPPDSFGALRTWNIHSSPPATSSAVITDRVRDSARALGPGASKRTLDVAHRWTTHFRSSWTASKPSGTVMMR